MAEEKLFTRAEVESIDKKSSNVFIIDDQVYDVYKFMEEHPGGHEVLQQVAGIDATENFDDIGHSLDAKALMVNFKIGSLVPEERSSKQVKRKDDSMPSGDQESTEGFSWMTPLVLGVLASVIYYYLFG